MEPREAAGRALKRAAAALAVALAGCMRGSAPSIALTDVTSKAGIAFVHESGARGEMLNPETFGPGAGWLDLDGDERQDILVVNGNTLRGEADPKAHPVLYRSLGGGNFEDATAASGVGVPFYGMGFVSGDVDNDGDQDILVYGLHRSVFFLNDGGGKVHDATASSGLASLRGWVGAAAFLDYDRDGKLDLFIGNYVSWSPEREKDLDCTFGTPRKKYCPVAMFPPSVPQLFRGRGDGAFEETTASAGFPAFETKALGVAAEDYDRDGWPDLFVANDSIPNLLLRNRGDGTFEDRGAASGFSSDPDGAALAGMGIDTAWGPDGGPLEVAVGNFAGEPTTLHVAEGDGTFTERSGAAGIGPATLDRVTFGLLLDDLDLDGTLDLTLANGHVFDVEEIMRVPYRQRCQVFLGREGGKFVEVKPHDAGHFLNRAIVARALAACDYDGDGDLDLLVTENQGRAVLLRNDLPAPARSVRVALRGTRSNRDAIGAEVTLRVDGGGRGASLRRTLKGSSSYLSQSERKLTFGLGAAGRPREAEVLWPSGLREVFRGLEAGRVCRLVEGEGEAVREAGGSAPAKPTAAPTATAARNRGLEALRARRWDDAAAAFAEAVKLDRHDMAAHRSRVEALTLAGRKPDASAALSEAFSAFPDAGVLVSHFGIVLRESGFTEAAERCFAEAARLEPRRADAWLALGNLAFDRKAHAEALERYRKALALAPESVEALANAGKVQAQMKDYARAKELLEKAVALRPDYAAALSTLGGVLVETGDLDRGEDVLRRALAARGSKVTEKTVWGNLGILYVRRRDRARAVECFRRVLELDPGDAQARAALERLRA